MGFPFPQAFQLEQLVIQNVCSTLLMEVSDNEEDKPQPVSDYKEEDSNQLIILNANDTRRSTIESWDTEMNLA